MPAGLPYLQQLLRLAEENLPGSRQVIGCWLLKGGLWQVLDLQDVLQQQHSNTGAIQQAPQVSRRSPKGAGQQALFNLYN